VNLSFAKSVWG